MLLLPGHEVMEKCALVYGRAISDRTWRTWKRVCEIPAAHPHVGEWLTEFQTKCLLVLAYLKKQNPWKHYTYEQVLVTMAKLRRKKEQAKFLDAIAETPVNTLVQPCYGRDLHKTLERLTGCDINPRRLYRIAERHGQKFSKAKQYSTKQINWWIEKLGA
ncbi:hypothetical protein H6F90_29770 [Trichocoleus sp. FACHB-591]|uniref:hypothetical protein n=1 Tax=Trichocoleus sp. FACHB-591 TaxID=2692872 RepID=UPI0016835081|nr:hypothetical protein [Trichocoleus sp. FACHB-591]MBD2099255.1 hypothetical protein [Trichocoleus sp. FACHB-591]